MQVRKPSKGVATRKRYEAWIRVRNTGMKLLIQISVILVIVLLVNVWGYDVPEKIARLLFEFDGYTELVYGNYPKLEEIVSDSVLEDITILNEDLLVSAYYKFRDTESKVEVISTAKNNVIFRIKNEFINYDTSYILLIERSLFGKVTKVSVYVVGEVVL